jgi:hypothetical protein
MNKDGDERGLAGAGPDDAGGGERMNNRKMDREI